MSKDLIALDTQGKFILLWPESLCGSYELNKPHKVRLNQILKLFQQALIQASYQQAVITNDHALEILGSVEPFYTTEELALSTSLERWEIEDYDNYFDVKRVQTKAPSECLLRSLLVAYRTFLELNKHCI